MTKISKNKKKSIRNKTIKRKKIIKKTKTIKKSMKGGVLDFSIMETPFNIPTQSYPLKKSDKDIKRYSAIMREEGFDERSIEESINALKILLENTTHVTFAELISSIKKTIIKFEEEIKDKPFYLFIPIIDGKPIQHKSNYWISKIFYLLMNKKPIQIIT